MDGVASNRGLRIWKDDLIVIEQRKRAVSQFVRALDKIGDLIVRRSTMIVVGIERSNVEGGFSEYF